MRRDAGLSFIEVIVASMLLILVMGLTYALFLAGLGSYDTEVPIREAQLRLQHRLDQMTQEIREASNDFFWAGNFSDAAFANPAQAWVMHPDARDAGGTPVVRNLQPVWQKAVLYAPYRHPRDGGQLRKYIITPIPPSWTKAGTPINVTFTATTIDVNGVTVPREGGTVVLDSLSQFSATLNPGSNNSLTFGATLEVSVARGKKALVSLSTAIRARN